MLPGPPGAVRSRALAVHRARRRPGRGQHLQLAGTDPAGRFEREPGHRDPVEHRHHAGLPVRVPGGLRTLQLHPHCIE
ncbi:hypothetical protein BZG21_32950, partial [Escherichia coli]|nr:hypothetical protein [Escherichia coli]